MDFHYELYLSLSLVSSAVIYLERDRRHRTFRDELFELNFFFSICRVSSPRCLTAGPRNTKRLLTNLPSSTSVSVRGLPDQTTVPPPRSHTQLSHSRVFSLSFLQYTAKFRAETRPTKFIQPSGFHRRITPFAEFGTRSRTIATRSVYDYPEEF